MGPHLRLFWGFDACQQGAALQACQQQLASTETGPPVPLDNLHLTLLFLGNAPLGTLPALTRLTSTTLARLPLASMTLTLDQLGLFPRAKAGWIGPSQIPEPLLLLEAGLRSAVSEAGWPLDPRPYRPHVTLFRKARALANPQITPIPLSLQTLHLYASLSTPQGVRYQPRASWSLGEHHGQPGAQSQPQR